ncbi:MAG: tetratricopeptide repeat protein [Bacteroidia bacterium]
MKKLIFYLLLALLSTPVISQVNLDSLQRIWLDSSRPDSTRLQAMQRIVVKGYLYTKPDSAFQCAKRMLAFAEERKLDHYIASALNMMGASSSIQGDNKQGIDYFTRSLKLAEQINDKSVGQCINNIGVIYYEMGNNDKAKEYFEKSLALSEKEKHKYGIVFALGNLANVSRNLNQFDKGLEYAKRSLAISGEIKDQTGIANAYESMATIYQDSGNPDTAMVYHQKALDIRRPLGDDKGIIEALMNIAQIDQKKGDLVKSTKEYEDVLKIAKAGNFIAEIRESASGLYRIYKKEGKSAQALEMHELFITMRDSLKNEEGQREVMRQEMEYNYEKQKALDQKEQEKELAVAAEQEKKQTIISWSIGIGLFLVLVFAMFVVNRLRLTAQQKKIIEHQKDLVEEKQKEILDSINYAKRLQEAILPPDNFVKQHLPESFIFYRPKDIVAGDFYWMESFARAPDSEGNSAEMVLIAAADCTGHGVPGAMVSVVCSNALNRAVFEFGKTEPGAILDKTRELVLHTFAKSDKDVKDGMDISLALINKKTNEIKWAGANSPLWYTSAGEIKELKADKQPIGKTENSTPFTTHTIQLSKGDSMFMLTDGFADQFGGDKGKKFKYKPLKEMLMNNSSLSMDQQMKAIDSAFEKWKSNLEQVDDICIIGVRL